MKRVELLKKQFAEYGLHNNISQEDLFDFLDFKQLDRNISQQIFDHMTKFNHTLTIQTFITSLLDAEEILIQKLNSSSANIQDFKQQKQDLINTLNQTEEYLNSHGIMEDSNLVIEVIDAQLQYKPYCDPYVIILCDSMRQQTKLSNMKFPQWNEQFTLQMNCQIRKGTEQIKFKVMAFHKETKDDGEVLGECEMSIKEFQDQNRHTLNLDIKGGKLHVVIQWFHSKRKYLEHLINKWEEHIKLQEEDYIDYNHDLQAIYFAFPCLQEQLPETPVKSIEITPSLPLMPSRISQLEVQSNEYETSLKYIVVILGVLELFGCFERCCFLDFLVLFAYYYVMNEMNKEYLKYITGACFSSFIFDLTWIIIGVQILWTNIHLQYSSLLSS